MAESVVKRYVMMIACGVLTITLWFWWDQGLQSSGVSSKKTKKRHQPSIPLEQRPVSNFSNMPLIDSSVVANSETQPYLYSDRVNVTPQSIAKQRKLDNADNARMHKQTPAQLWQNWKKQLERGEFQRIPILGTLLSERLRKYPDLSVYESIANILSQPDVPIENKVLLLDLLTEIATPQALAQLIELAETEINSSMYMLIVQAISRIGDNRWDGKFHDELSPVLEAAWADPPANTDQIFIRAVGKAIAEVGAADGVNALLLTVSGKNNTKKTEEYERIKQEVALKAIPRVRNPHAIEVLNTQLVKAPIGTAAFEVSGSALSAMSTPKATQKIVAWAQKAPDEGARNLQYWLTKVSDASSVQLVTAAQKLPINSTKITAVLNDFVSSSSTSMVLPKAISSADVPRR
ncbi:MAG: hypothetical protein ABL933_05080 [Methyloglobulus sp.]|nr:hypothetical protein [Methyloglobulus sp.]